MSSHRNEAVSDANSKEILVHCYDSNDSLASIRKEIAQGLAYRKRNPHVEKILIEPIHSPINIPLQICRSQQKSKIFKPSRIPVLCKKISPIATEKHEKCQCAPSLEKSPIKKIVYSSVKQKVDKCKCGLLNTQFKSTPILDQFKQKRSLRSQFKSTSVLDTVKEYQSQIPRPKNCKSNVKKTSTLAAFSTQKEDRNNLRLIGSGSFLEKNSVKKQILTKANSSKKLLSSKSSISKKEKSKTGLGQSDPKPVTLLNRSCLCQKEYMTLLSTPKPRSAISVDKCTKCKLRPCPPRLVQMSIPNKRYVLSNWQAYQNFLPAEVLTRFDKILQSGNNELEPRDARYYFKQRKKFENKKKKKSKCKQKCCHDNLWLIEQVNELTDVILVYFQYEPVNMLNFKEMLVSDEILKFLEHCNLIKISPRSTKNIFKQTVIEICDKMVTWMDKLHYFLEMKPHDSTEKMQLQYKPLPGSMRGVFQVSSTDDEEEEKVEEESQFEGEEEWLEFILEKGDNHEGNETGDEEDNVEVLEWKKERPTQSGETTEESTYDDAMEMQ